jgi:Nucleotide modification associated domain 3
MKLILSPKGFDSSAGGVPSPIFPDGTMISLPIPDKASPIAYRHIAGSRHASVGELVNDLARRPPVHRAHLDPDLSADALPRMRGWRPIFGQEGAAEKHLENHGVGAGDVFVFFGRFQRVERTASQWRYVRSCRPIHVIFAWLQVAERVPVCEWPGDAEWARYHPHFHRQRHEANVIYVATERLVLPGLKTLAVPGAGLFPAFTPQLQLTEPLCERTSQWLLPKWFDPQNRGSVLTYHGDASRWQKVKDGVLLTAASRGQEFVLECDDYPEAVKWVAELLALAIV